MPQLNIPHHYQFGWGLANLCGQSCVASAVGAFTSQRPNPKEVALATGTADGQPRNFADMIRMAKYYGVTLTYTNQATVQWVRDRIDEGRMPILLVAYEQFRNRPNTYTAAHFLTATGYNHDTFVLNDSLQPKGGWVVAAVDLEKALNTPSTILGGTNRPNQALVSEQRIETMSAGVNINLLHDGIGKPPISALLGTKFARFPYNVADLTADRGNTNLALATPVYKPYIDQLVTNGIMSMLVLTHQFYGQGAGYNWSEVYNNEASADRFIERYVAQCAEIAKQYAYLGNKVIFQVWNEQDTKPGDGRAAVPLQPRTFGRLFNAAYTAIKTHAPQALVITGGFKDGAGISGQYYLDAQITRLDGIGIHPYGQGKRSNPDYRIWGALEDYLWTWRQFTAAPLYITEFGVLDNPTAPIARVISYAQDFITAGTPYNVKSFIWYAWADGMDNGYGVVNAAGELKRTEFGKTLMDVFKGSTVTTPPVTSPDFGAVYGAGKLRIIGGSFPLNVRNVPSVSGSSVVGQVLPGQQITAHANKQTSGGYVWTPVVAGTLRGWIASKSSTWSTQLYVDL